jgi:hypothetical protein
MSFLAEPPDVNFEDPPPAPLPPARPSKFGAMKANAKAQVRRGKVKLFDSADWAMKNKDPSAAETDAQAPTAFPIPDAPSGDSAIAGPADE